MAYVLGRELMKSVNDYLKYGLQTYQKGDHALAVAIWQEGLKHYSDPSLYMNIGAGLRRLKLYNEARLVYVGAILKNPSFVGLRMNYINLLSELGEFGKALGAFDGWPGWGEIPRFTGVPLPFTEPCSTSSEYPSADYVNLLAQYAQMHISSDDARTRRKVFDGVFGLSRHGPLVQRFCSNLGARTILDYGGGKGRQYLDIMVETPDGRTFPDLKTYLTIDNVQSWDPGANAGAELTRDSVFDVVLCMDVLEHCPADDLPWIIDGLFQRARYGVYMSIGNYPAAKKLPDGRNVHITIQPVAWWAGLIARAAQAYPAIRYQAYVAANANDLGVLIEG